VAERRDRAPAEQECVMLSNEHEHEQLCFVCYRVVDMPTPRVPSGQWDVRWLRRADLGTEEIARRTAENLYSLHRSRRFARKLMQTFAVAFKQSAQPG
jgi:hypothetical protein